MSNRPQLYNSSGLHKYWELLSLFVPQPYLKVYMILRLGIGNGHGIQYIMTYYSAVPSNPLCSFIYRAALQAPKQFCTFCSGRFAMREKKHCPHKCLNLVGPAAWNQCTPQLDAHSNR